MEVWGGVCMEKDGAKAEEDKKTQTYQQKRNQDRSS